MESNIKEDLRENLRLTEHVSPVKIKIISDQKVKTMKIHYKNHDIVYEVVVDFLSVNEKRQKKTFNIDKRQCQSRW